MRKITLSSFTQDQAGAAADKRQERYMAALSEYHERLEQRAARQRALGEAWARAWRDRRLLACLWLGCSRILHAVARRPASPRMAQASRDEIVWQAGSEGEQRALEAFAYRLSDDWVAISGYHNPGGEIDLLLVGPQGVMAIEIKYLNGQVQCVGDRWWRDKYDKYGNLVEQMVPIVDRGGRGPSAQVNAAADKLQQFLAERSPVQRVLRAVIFSHESSRIGALRSVTVDAVALARAFDVTAVFRRVQPVAEAISVEQVVQLIERDHGFHARRQRVRRVGRDALRHPKQGSFRTAP